MLLKTRRLTIALSLLLASACGGFHRGGPTDPLVHFINDSPDQADVYVVGAGGPVRIGTVFAGRTESLRVPTSIIGGSHSVEILVRIFASNRYVRSGQVTLSSGESVDVRLAADEKLLSVLPSANP